MTEEGTIAGRVLGADGRPLADAIVLITESPTPHPDIAQVTRDDGQFCFGAPAPGTYEVLVRSDDDEARASFVVAEGEHAETVIRIGR